MTYPQQTYGQPGGYTGPGAPPPPPSQGGPRLSEHVGDLIYVKVLRYDPEFITRNGVKPAVFLDVEILDGRSDVGTPYYDALFSNVILVSQLQQAVGQEMFGRIGARPGNNANPAIFLDSPRAGDERIIEAFLSRRNGQGGQQPQQGQNAPQTSPQPQQQPQQGYGQPQGMPPATPPPASSYGQPSRLPDEPPF
jgi:hypothetical protein